MYFKWLLVIRNGHLDICINIVVIIQAFYLWSFFFFFIPSHEIKYYGQRQFNSISFLFRIWETKSVRSKHVVIVIMVFAFELGSIAWWINCEAFVLILAHPKKKKKLINYSRVYSICIAQSSVMWMGCIYIYIYIYGLNLILSSDDLGLASLLNCFMRWQRPEGDQWSHGPLAFQISPFMVMLSPYQWVH
jgi:hypothetical protein